MMLNGVSGDVARDHYNRWREDIAIMKRLNLQADRFPVSWSRVIPEGHGAINARGLDFYDKLIDSLLYAEVIKTHGNMLDTLWQQFLSLPGVGGV